MLENGRPEVPELERPERLTPELEAIRALYDACKGNLVRVHEELEARGVQSSYTGLTAYCRRHGIGQVMPVPAGAYHFGPGKEMQHDTSPHAVRVGDRERRYQCASLVLCYSRMIYARCYRHWTRIECRIFLSEAVQALGGAAEDCMIDNSSIIIAHGNGANAVAAECMQALGRRFGFRFIAHELGDANRSARVERPFGFIERNFYPGRTFADDDDLNAQMAAWCDRVNHKHRRSLKAAPIELWTAEKPALRALPIHIPEVHDVHTRRVDVEGYVNLHLNRYSVPAVLIGRQVEVRETAHSVRIYDGHRMLAEHPRLPTGEGARSCLSEHHVDRKPRAAAVPHSPEEKLLRGQDPSLATLCDLLRKRHGGGAVRAIRRLHRLFLDYPTESLVAAARRAVDHGLVDLGRLETMVLRAVAGDFFRIPLTTPDAESSCDQKDRQDPIPGDEPGKPPGPGGDPDLTVPDPDDFDIDVDVDDAD